MDLKKKNPKTTKKEEDTFWEIRKHNWNKDKKLIILEMVDHYNGIYVRREQWVNWSTETIYSLGFRKAERFFDELKYSGVKAYIMMIGFKEAEPMNYETSGSLADFYLSNSPAQFKKGFTKVNLPPLDTKKLMVMVPIIIGALIGFYLLFGKG